MSFLFRIRTWHNGHLLACFIPLSKSITWTHDFCVGSMFQSITLIGLWMLKLSQRWPVGSSIKLVPLFKNCFKNQSHRLESDISLCF